VPVPEPLSAVSDEWTPHHPAACRMAPVRRIADLPGIAPERGGSTEAVENVIAADGGLTSRVRLRRGLRADPGTQARIACSSGPTPMIAITRFML